MNDLPSNKYNLVTKGSYPCKGTVMSPRMARIQYYMRTHRKIPIHDWSTDQTVMQVWDQLVAAQAYIEEMMKGAKQPDGENYSQQELGNMLVDIAAIMRRRPENRINEKP